jgi:hypothetical protein
VGRGSSDIVSSSKGEEEEEKGKEKRSEGAPDGKVGDKLRNLPHKESSASMSITVSPASIKRKERQEIIEEVQKQMKEAALQANKQVIMACLEAEVTAK